MNKTHKISINWNNVKLSDLQFKKTAHYGHNVSHAKNRTSRKFKRNLHKCTVVLNGIKHKVQVPKGVLNKLKEFGLTTHKIVKKA